MKLREEEGKKELRKEASKQARKEGMKSLKEKHGKRM